MSGTSLASCPHQFPRVRRRPTTMLQRALCFFGTPPILNHVGKAAAPDPLRTSLSLRLFILTRCRTSRSPTWLRPQTPCLWARRERPPRGARPPVRFRPTNDQRSALSDKPPKRLALFPQSTARSTVYAHALCAFDLCLWARRERPPRGARPPARRRPTKDQRSALSHEPPKRLALFLQPTARSTVYAHALCAFDLGAPPRLGA
jgi:hypothetical protein